MRYRIYLDNTQVEVDCSDIRVIGKRRVTIKVFGELEQTQANRVTIYFPSDIEKITDNHGREVFSV